MAQKLSDTAVPDPPGADLLATVGLTEEEYGRVCELIGRKPNIVELGIFGAMWSEHCSYKTSKIHLKKLPVEGARVLQGPGENAGVMDLGNDYAVVFKIESHNHPSAVEPFQGAATGVGGIIRDIFAMGARPLALLNSLRFGNLTEVAAIGEEITALESANGSTPDAGSNDNGSSAMNADAIDWQADPAPFVFTVAWLTEMRKPYFTEEHASVAREKLKAIHESGSEILAFCIMPDQILFAASIRGGDEKQATELVQRIKDELGAVLEGAVLPETKIWEDGFRLQRRFDQQELDESVKRLEYTPVMRGTVKQIKDYPYVSAVWQHGSAWVEGSDAVSMEETSRIPYCPGVNADQAARNGFLLNGVVSGIAHYGNCIGIPTLGGEVVFDPSYNANCLVNAMCVGIVKKDSLLKAVAHGAGNTALVVGQRTGRDGVQGATFASVDLADDYAESRPAVQVGDPFLGKLLLEATLEIVGMEGLIGVQDFGAAGLTCSSVEMAARAGTGMQLDLDRVPQRAKDLSAYEMMLSETQERMMIVVEAGSEQRFIDAFSKWGLTAVPCGEVHGKQQLAVLHNGAQVATLPNAPLGDEAPQYDRPAETPEYIKQARQLNDRDIEEAIARIADGLPEETQGLCEALNLKLLASPNIASKYPIHRQYDSMVRSNTVQGPGAGDAGVMRIKETGQALALSTDGSGKHVYLYPRTGAARCVLESARNVIAAGAAPLGITNCLNFGNPQKPDRMWQFVEVIEGMGEALRELDLPVTGGNVSLYNESAGQSILPTPTIGMVGLIEDARKAVPGSTDADGHEIYVLGESDGRLDGSTLAFDLGRCRTGKLMPHDYQQFRESMRFILAAAEQQAIAACHDISDGGLAVALTEMCSAGADVEIDELMHRLYDREAHNAIAALFGEEGHRWLIAVAPDKRSWLRTAALHYKAPLKRLGTTGGGELHVSLKGQSLLRQGITELRDSHREGLALLMAG